VPHTEGLKVVGGYIGHDDYIGRQLDTYFDKGIDKLLTGIVDISRLDQPAAKQAAVLLLRYSALPRIIHLLRNTPPRLMVRLAQKHDRSMLATLSSIIGDGDPLGVDMESWGNEEWTRRLAAHQLHEPEDLRRSLSLAQEQATLSIEHGGVGLTSMTKLSNIAYLGSIADWARAELPPAARDLVEKFRSIETHEDTTCQMHDDFLDALYNTADDLGTLTSRGQDTLRQLLGASSLTGFAIANAGKGVQHKIYDAANANWALALQNKCPLGGHNNVRLQACSGFGAGAWLHALPHCRELTVTNNAMEGRLCQLLGLPITYLVNGPTTCNHAATDLHAAFHHDTDNFGNSDHACARSNRIARHDRLQAGGLQRGLALCGIASHRCTIDTLKLDADDKTEKRPDVAVLLPNDYATTLLDVVITHPLTATNLNRYTQPGDAAVAAEKRKMTPTLYTRKAAKLGMKVVPFAVETLGAWGPSGIGLLDKIAVASKLSARAPSTFGRTTAPSARTTFTQLVAVNLCNGLDLQLRHAHDKRLLHDNLATKKADPDFYDSATASMPSLDDNAAYALPDKDIDPPTRTGHTFDATLAYNIDGPTGA
jgi:hypothetical protein